MADISFKDAQKLVKFKLIMGDSIAQKEGWGNSLFLHERDVESMEHRLLINLSIRHLRNYDYKINRMAVGVEGVYALSDYFAVKNDVFFFVECLTKKTLELQPEILFKKLQLSAYAPMWLIIPKNVDISMIPVGSAHVLFVDFEKKELIAEFKGSFNSFKRRKVNKYAKINNVNKEYYHRRLNNIREEYPNAYKSWEKNEDEFLLRLFKEGKSNKAISGILKRQPGAIRSRLVKLGVLEGI